MVVRSENESIVRCNRGFIVGLLVLGWVFILIAVVALRGALLGKVTWLVALPFAVTALYLVWRVFSIARSFSRSFVAIGPEGVRLGLLKRTEATWSPLQEQSFRWEEIGHITYDSDKGICRFRAPDYTYELTDDNSPSPRTVAKLMAERKGVELPAQESLVPRGEKRVPFRTQAAIIGGISLPLLGAAVAGALLMHSRDAKFGAIVGFGLPA